MAEFSLWTINMDNDIILYLPWPPTINDYYGVTRQGQRFLKTRATTYRKDVAQALHEQCPALFLDEHLFMEVYLYPPDNRKRDLDNYMKGLLDALTEGGLWEDDSLIDQLHIYRGVTTARGKVRIELSEAGPIMK